MYKYGIIETENRGKANRDVVLTWLFEDNGTLSIFGAGMLPDYKEDQDRPWQEYADQIRAIVVDDGITTIGARTFCGYEKLESVKLPGTVSRIGFRAFAGCTSLKTVTTPRAVAHINSTNLSGTARSILREDTVYMGMQSFAGSPWVVETYGDFYIHQGVLVEYYGAGGEVSVPAGVREIGTSAFEGSGVTAVKLPNTLKVIGAFAFNKTPLQTIELPASVSKVARYAFAQTGQMTSVLVGNPWAVIESMAFWNSAVEEEVILSKKDRSAIAKAHRMVQKAEENYTGLTADQLKEAEEAKVALAERTFWKEAQKANAVPEHNEWTSVYTVESVREAGMEPCKRLEVRRDPKRLIGLTAVKAGEAVIKKLSSGGPVIRIRLNEERKTVQFVQSFAKEGKDTFTAYLMYPIAAGDEIAADREKITNLTKAEMLVLDGEGLRAGEKGCVWYQAPRGTALGVSTEMTLLQAWLAKHPEYQVVGRA